MNDLEPKLETLDQRNGITRSKGKLSVVLFVTRYALENGLPLNPNGLKTKQKGQVAGLSRSAVQSILADYGIQRILAQEAGRTSRGSLGMMESYVSFLNQLEDESLADLQFIEEWWIRKIQDYFASQPFVLRRNAGRSVRAVIRDLLDQAHKRQSENPGTTYIGTVLQHLVGAKLTIVMKERGTSIESHSASTADAPTARYADFIIGTAAIHVTASPSAILFEKCKENLESGLHPVVVTVNERIAMADGNADAVGIGADVDILAIEQFIATNLFELSGFQSSERQNQLEILLNTYNNLVDQHETDPSIKIKF